MTIPTWQEQERYEILAAQCGSDTAQFLAGWITARYVAKELPNDVAVAAVAIRSAENTITAILLSLGYEADVARAVKRDILDSVARHCGGTVIRSSAERRAETG